MIFGLSTQRTRVITVLHQPRAATITAVEGSRCVTIDRATFLRLLGPMKDLLQVCLACVWLCRDTMHVECDVTAAPSRIRPTSRLLEPYTILRGYCGLAAAVSAC